MMNGKWAKVVAQSVGVMGGGDNRVPPSSKTDYGLCQSPGYLAFRFAAVFSLFEYTLGV